MTGDGLPPHRMSNLISPTVVDLVSGLEPGSGRFDTVCTESQRG